MGQVIANASMSLDGYIAEHDNTIGVPVVVVTHKVPTQSVDAHPAARPCFGELTEDIPLGDPVECVQGKRVTHLVFPVEKTKTSSVEGRA